MAPRTAHRVVCGLEDAEFEVRDQYLWLYGQGSPKSLLIARRIDVSLCRQEARHYTVVLPKEKKRKPGDHICAETPEGLEWAGWGTALKAAYEPISRARKPMAKSTTNYVREHGIGGLNVTGCRLEGPDGDGH